MVDTIKCEHCGAKTKHPVVKVIDGKELDFCCAGCLQVYAFLREEGLLDEVKAQERDAKNSAQDKR